VSQPTYLNHWDDYGGFNPEWACNRSPEFCTKCGLELVQTIEPTGFRSRTTGQMTFARWHSCPTWVTGWRASKWAKGWATPGWGHTSHDADNQLSSRDYR
jgi:hypothetical protein